MPESTQRFRACDTTWSIHASGERAHEAVEAARGVVLALERKLDAFDADSVVSRFYREGRARDADVACLLRRAEEYAIRTSGAFDVGHGRLEHAIKASIRGGPLVLEPRRRARFRVAGDLVTTDMPLDLNGIAKGYIVDAARQQIAAMGATGFVDGGGDIATPTGPVAIESPHDASRVLGVLDTRWCVATSGRAKRRRGDVDHIYDPRVGRVGARHEQVTVVAQRDCVEADVLATTLCVLSLEEGHRLVEGWPGVEALWVDGQEMRASGGFGAHVWKA